MRSLLLATLLAVSLVSCKKEPTPQQPDPPVNGATWSIDGKGFFADSAARRVSTAIYVIHFYAADLENSFQFEHAPVPGTYSIPDYDEFSLKHFQRERQMHWRVVHLADTFRNYNNEIPGAVRMYDSVGKRWISTAPIILHNSMNRNDSILVQVPPTISAGSTGPFSLVVNGNSLPLSNTYHQMRCCYSWLLRAADSNSLSLSLYTRPTSDYSAFWGDNRANGARLNIAVRENGNLVQRDAVIPNTGSLSVKMVSGGFQVQFANVQMRNFQTSNDVLASGSFFIKTD